jgi:hypothetical protein
MASTHDHQAPGFPEDADEPGAPSGDTALMGRFLAAAFAECASCQDVHAIAIAADPVTTVLLVVTACALIDGVIGGLPRALTDGDAPGVASLPFRRLARAGTGGPVGAMLAASRAMSPADRRAAIETAADLVIGVRGALG